MDARTAIHRYCQYQERCHSEVRAKLYDIGCSTSEVEEYIAELIETGLLNEERFAKAYARGKFRIKSWGRRKIIQNLKLKKVSEYCIKKGLAEIDNVEYEQTLGKLVEKKWHEFGGEKKVAIRRSKVFRNLAQKGYEPDILLDVINKIIQEEADRSRE